LEASAEDAPGCLGIVPGTVSRFDGHFENDGSSGFENFKDQSTSDEITIEQETRVIIPNAFTPGLPPNDIFRPLLAFIDVNGYVFSIYNKWGQMIFSTDDPSEGWDGTFQGDYVASDAYVYLIVYRTPEGQINEKRGTVTVVR
jgi:gliding motility-associated-like protein